MSNITINDIAREAQVSKATVSRVLNNPSIVDAVTREKVQQVIDKYQYKPSALARNMSIQRTTSIGVLIPEVDNPFFSNILRGSLQVASQKDYTIVCFNSDEFIDRDIKAIQEMISYKYSGVLYTPVQSFERNSRSKEVLQLLKTFNAPVVLMDRDNPALADEYDSVVFDDARSICESVEKLAAAGHTRIGIMNGPDISYLAGIRNEGYLRGLRKCGLPYDPSIHYILPEYSKEASYERTCALLKEPNRPSAFITGNNFITLGFLKALHEFGLEISRDVEMIALDWIEALDITGSDLNYIERDGTLLGQKAAELLFKRIDNSQAEKQNIVLDHRIVIRRMEKKQS